jgi:Cys-tRNA(Pro) deacylase
VHKKLHVAVTTGEGRLDQTEHRPTLGAPPFYEPGANALADGGIGDDAVMGDVEGAGFELWFQEDDARGCGRKTVCHGRQDLRQGDEREIRDEELERREWGQGAGIHALDVRDARVCCQAWMELAMADIDGKDGGGAMLEEAVGETASRGAEIEAGEAGDFDREGAERGLELEPSATDVCFLRFDSERGTVRDEVGRAADRFTSGEGVTRLNEAARLLARLDKATLDEEEIGANSDHRSIVDCRLRIVDWMCGDALAGRLPGMSATERVRAALKELGLPSSVTEFDASTRTAEEAAQAVGCEPGQIVKTLVFMAEGRPTVVLVAGDRQADTSKLAQLLGVGRKKLRMGSPNEVLAMTGFEVGAVAPVGMVNQYDVVVDETLKRFERVWAAAGTGSAVFGIETKALVKATEGQWADIAREAAGEGA